MMKRFSPDRHINLIDLSMDNIKKVKKDECNQQKSQWYQM